MTGVDVVVAEAEALRAEHEGDADAVRARASAKSSRGAWFGGPKSRGVIAVAQT